MKNNFTSLSAHMAQTHQFLTTIVQATKSMIPTMMEVQRIKRERYIRNQWHPDEGPEDSTTMQEIDETLNTGQGSI